MDDDARLVRTDEHGEMAGCCALSGPMIQDDAERIFTRPLLQRHLRIQDRHPDGQGIIILLNRMPHELMRFRDEPLLLTRRRGIIGGRLRFGLPNQLPDPFLLDRHTKASIDHLERCGPTEVFAGTLYLFFKRDVEHYMDRLKH